MAVAADRSDALFLGCIAPLRFPDIEKATRVVFGNLGVDLKDIEGFACCPTKATFTNVDEVAALAMSGRNIALAEAEGANMVTICNGCFSILAEAKHELDHDPVKRAEVQKVLKDIGHRYRGTSKVLHMVDFVHNEVGLPKVTTTVKHSLRGLRVAIFHGCHYLRPAEVLGIDDPENPRKIKEIVSALGGKNVPFVGQLDCCGAGGGVRARDPDTAMVILEERLKAIERAQVEAIVTVCPFCFLHFDLGQEALKERGGSYSIPVFHLSQLMALAQGADPKEVARMSKTPRQKVIASILGDGR